MIEKHDFQDNEPQQDALSPSNSDVPADEDSRLTQIIPPQSTLHSLYIPDPAKPRLPRIKHHNLLGEESIAFYIGDLDDPLVVEVKDRITLGRYGPYSSQPSVDLAPYGAFERGV